MLILNLNKVGVILPITSQTHLSCLTLIMLCFGDDVFRLRSYGPALFTYCKSNIVDKAFEVDDHMQEAGIEPEESELEALLQVSVQANLEDKVYSLLHRLRKSVRELKPNTSEVIERWFRSSAAAAASISSREEDAPGPEDVQIAMEKGGIFSHS